MTIIGKDIYVDLNILIRPYEENDYAFVKSSWIKHQALTIPFKLMKSGEFYETYSKILDTRIGQVSIMVACNPEFTTQTFGYIAYDKKTLHFIYVKGLYRNLKISKNMVDQAMPEGGSHFTHQSDNKFFRQLVKKYKMIYNPFLFLGNTTN